MPKDNMVRDLGNMKHEYVELLAKKQESALATSLERQQQGAQFRVAELPRDADVLDAARADAERIAAVDVALSLPEHALLADALLAVFGDDALAPIRA